LRHRIRLVTDGSAWAALATPGCCWYNNDATTCKDTYGALYNWYVLDAASNGSKNVCPKGWHAPSDAEWTTLTLLARSSGG
jgi:Fibrobacter succinogenes major domain (Fib_succ_major).